MELRAASIIDPEIEGHYAYFPLVQEISTQKHRHDFYEIFLIVRGEINHHIDDEIVLLSEGQLVFIRPDDAHFFSQHAAHNCELLNIAFLQGTCRVACDYLGSPLDRNHLHETHLPPTVSIVRPQRSLLSNKMQAWGRFLYRDKQQSRLALRGLLAQILAEHFLTDSTPFLDNTPQWLREVCQQMRETDNVIEGRPALLRLAQRTPEYVGRSFKQHLGMTPSQFINDLRLDYASDLLLHSDASPTDICYEVGFGNLSHFHHLFKARWGYPPTMYRKLNRRTLPS